MQQRILLVTAEIDLRARIGRELQASGHAIELASDLKRAFRLASDHNFQTAIVALELNPASLAMLLELRDTVSEMIILAKQPDEIARLGRSLSGLDAIFLEKSNKGALLARISEIMELADRTARKDTFAPTIIRIEDRTLDLARQILVDPGGQEVTLA
jgi:DNA-binding response OmpR family regulator